MRELEILLGNRWVLKAENKDLYYRIRDAAAEIRKFTAEKMGCQLIENALLVKLEKIPVIPEPFMGVQEFTSKEEYAFLCVLLMFLEDKDAGEQFILSQLTEYAALQMPGETVDWTVYTNRRRLIKVLRYAISQSMLKITDGSDEAFMDSVTGEVLYESTGASRYFMRTFARDIMGYPRPEDFEQSDWFDINEDKGIARRQRVYKRLLFAPGMYRRDGSQEDFAYLKYYGRRLSEELEKIFDCRVHIHKGSAYLMPGEQCRMGKEFPAGNVLADIVLLVLRALQDQIRSGIWETEADETCVVSDLEFERMIREVKQAYAGGFAKKYREMPDGEFVNTITDEMERWMFIKVLKEARQIRIYPAAGKLCGRYPDGFADKAEHAEKTEEEREARV